MEGLAKRLSAEEQRAVDITNLQPMRVLISDFQRRASTWREVS